MSKAEHGHPGGPLSGLPTRRVMGPVLIAAALFALLIGLNAPETPGFVPAGLGQDGLSLVLDDRTPARSAALSDAFVQASSEHQKSVLTKLSALEERWRDSGTRVTVTTMELSEGALSFAEQLDQWLAASKIGAETPFLNDDMGEVGHPPAADGLVIRCRTSERIEAQQLALALAPTIRGEVSIRFTERAKPNQLDIFIEGAPRFNDSGVAYFPAVDVDA